MSTSRRRFLKTTLAGLAAYPAGYRWSTTGEMTYRLLGKTGQRVSLVTLGGAHIGYDHVSESEATRIVHAAIDGGVNFFDNSWDYNGGRSEERMGEALSEDGKRKKVFLMTKFCCHRQGWTKDAALQMLHDSLRRLRTDYLDLWQIHEVIDPEHPEKAFLPGSAVDALVDARDSGKVRYVGFTGHRDPSIHLAMLGKGFPFDTVQMPLNVMDAHFRSFARQVLPELNARQIGVIGMKPLGGGNRESVIVSSGRVSAVECLRYAMSLPVSTVCTGIPSLGVLEQALEIARDFQPYTEQEMATLLGRTRELAQHGRFERYKTG